MQGFRRFAVYYLPEPGALADELSSWLGWDIATGQPVAHPVIDGWDVPALTATPRKYGAHGTIKPPFALVDSHSLAELDAAMGALCASVEPVVLEGLKVARLGGFLALVPKGDTNALSLLAAATVSGLDDFRAPQSQAQIDKRRAAGLTNRQDELLERWGYPYVMDEFRFHITLTGKVDEVNGEALRKVLKKRIKPLLTKPFVIESLCLAGEDEAGMFHLIHRYALTG